MTLAGSGYKVTPAVDGRLWAPIRDLPCGDFVPKIHCGYPTIGGYSGRFLDVTFCRMGLYAPFRVSVGRQDMVGFAGGAGEAPTLRSAHAGLPI